MRVDELVDLLACPQCHHKLHAVEEAAGPAPQATRLPASGLVAAAAAGPAPQATRLPASGLVCEACKLYFALEDGLPNMLISEARAWPLPVAPTSA